MVFAQAAWPIHCPLLKVSEQSVVNTLNKHALYQLVAPDVVRNS